MDFRNQILIATTLTVTTLSAIRAEAQTAYALSSSGANLIRFDIATPNATTVVGPISGAFSVLNGLDFRAADGKLYGYNYGTDGIVLIDVNTAVTTLVSTSSHVLLGFELGLDFNPQADRLRVVNTAGSNVRINVASGAATVDPNLTLGGDTPSVIEAAYTNNDNDINTSTTLYYIDNRTDSLYTTANPNLGVLSLVGSLNVDTNRFTGFDIVTYGGVNYAYAILTDPNSQRGFYSIDLTTGAATQIGLLNADITNVFGLSITPVPEPGSLALIVTAAAGLLAYRRRTYRAS